MPLSSKGEEIMGNMKKEYGSEKGEQVFYASKNKGTISGVDCSKLDAICDSMARLGERVDAYGKRRADAGPREENFQRATKASENREKEERDKKLEQLGRAFGRSRGDEEEMRADIDSVWEVFAIVSQAIVAGNILGWTAAKLTMAIIKIRNALRNDKISSTDEAKLRDALEKLEEAKRSKTRKDEGEARDDAYDPALGGSMELLSKMRTDAARADFDPFTITMATIAGWSLYEIVQNIRQFRSLGKHNKEMQDLIDRLETEKKKREARGDAASDKPSHVRMSEEEWRRLDDPEELAKDFEKLAVATRSRNPELAKLYLQKSKQIRARKDDHRVIGGVKLGDK